jgi:hypothetical protein
MEPQSQTPAVEAPNLALSDLVLLLNLIRITSERGAIKADELTAVGAVYDKLLAFLEASGAIERTPTPDEPAIDGPA